MRCEDSRDRLLQLVAQVRRARQRQRDDSGFLAEFELIVPGTDIAALCDSDYDDETIVDLCLGERDALRARTREELRELVRRLQSTSADEFKTEAEAIQAVLIFKYNCRHPASSDLIFFPQEHFPGRPNPTPEEIVEKALRGE